MGIFRRSTLITIILLYSFSGLVDTIVFSKTGNHLPQCLWFSNSFFTVDGCIGCVKGILECVILGFFYMFSIPNEKLKSYIIILCKGNTLKHIFRILMVDKRKSVSKHSFWHRRNRISTPDLLFPYLPGPELFISLPMLTVQTMPAHSTSRSGSSLSNASPFISGYSSFANPIAPFDSNLVPSNSGPSYTEPDVVEDLSIRSTTLSVFSPQMGWCGPLRPSTSYIASVQSDPMISISRNPYSDIQRFYKTSGCQIIH